MKPRILVVDNDEAITRQLFWTLCDDYEVVTANTLQTAVRRAAIYEPAVTILDLNFSNVVGSSATGLRILDYIKAHVPKSRVLGMTSDGGLDAKKGYLNLGVDELLNKPFDTEQLLRFVRRLALKPA